MNMEGRAVARYIRVSPRKARAVIGLIRGKKVEEALRRLLFSDKRAAGPVDKTLKSALANIEKKAGEKSIDVDMGSLYVKEAQVNAGPTLKRFIPRAMGRATAINKRTSHITIVVEERKPALEEHKPAASRAKK